MQSRIAKLRERLAAQRLDAIVITHPSNRRYLTGFTAEDHPPNESAGHVVVGSNRAVLVTSTLEAERARTDSPDLEIFDRVRPMAKADADVLKELGASRVGFEDDAILYKDVSILQEELGEEVEIVPVGSLVDELREIKSAGEIDILTRAIRITDEAFERVAPTIAVGDTEREIAWRIDSAMRDLGAEGPAFTTIVASGPNSALPHYAPADRRIEEGEPIVIDMGALVDGYCGDLTRTLWVGEPNETLRAIYPIVMRAVEATESALKAGMTGKEGDALARDVITEAGYGEYLIHSVGHGLGIQVHEAPSMSPRSSQVLEPGHVVTVEPGIYLPGRGGVRIEDVAVIEENGVRILTRAAKNRIEK